MIAVPLDRADGTNHADNFLPSAAVTVTSSSRAPSFNSSSDAAARFSAVIIRRAGYSASTIHNTLRMMSTNQATPPAALLFLHSPQAGHPHSSPNLPSH